MKIKDLNPDAFNERVDLYIKDVYPVSDDLEIDTDSNHNTLKVCDLDLHTFIKRLLTAADIIKNNDGIKIKYKLPARVVFAATETGKCADYYIDTCDAYFYVNYPSIIEEEPCNVWVEVPGKYDVINNLEFTINIDEVVRLHQQTKATKILAANGAAWFSEFLYDGNFGLQSGKYYMQLEQGCTEGGEPPWVYASADPCLHSEKLSDCDPKHVYEDLGECNFMWLDFREDSTATWKVLDDRFVNDIGYEFGVISDGKRITNLPDVLIKYYEENEIRKI